MNEANLHSWSTLAVYISAVATVGALVFLTAPYGRHGRPGWGPTVGPVVGWILMESPAVLAFIAIFSLGSHRAELVPLVLLAIWQFHYVYRAFIFPFRVRSSRRMPLSIAVLGAAYNLLNAYVNARWISEFGVYPREWLADPRFVVGLGIFGLGWLLNQHADHVLLHLRKPGQEGYVIPRGGLYRWVSCPNYLGEMLEWLGWACLCWSFAGLSFFVFTTANLFPRALAHHAWYREKFEDYPRERKAILPGIC